MTYLNQPQAVSYAPESCARCGGKGVELGSACPACNGTGKVLVHQPARKCPMCGGGGENAFALFYGQSCVLCYGRGWALALKQ